MSSSPRALSQRVGIIGDVHTESAALARAIELLRDKGASDLLCVGDLADGPEEVIGLERCRDLLIDHDVFVVCGNHDRWLLEDSMRDLDDAIERHELEPDMVDYLEGLPATIEFTSPDGPLLLCHGLGGDDMGKLDPLDGDRQLRSNSALQDLLRDANYRIVTHGHSHLPMVTSINGTLFVNAGTLHRDFEPCVVLLDFAQRNIDFYDVREGGDQRLLDRHPLQQ